MASSDASAHHYPSRLFRTREIDQSILEAVEGASVDLLKVITLAKGMLEAGAERRPLRPRLRSGKLQKTWARSAITLPSDSLAMLTPAGRVLRPYGVVLGLNGGYTWASGLRLGVDGQCGLGFLPCSTPTAGPSVAYDLVVSSWRFPGSFDAGVWFAYSPPKLYAAPGLALIWQHGDFEIGFGPRYVVAPMDSFQLTLMIGTRF